MCFLSFRCCSSPCAHLPPEKEKRSAWTTIEKKYSFLFFFAFLSLTICFCGETFATVDELGERVTKEEEKLKEELRYVVSSGGGGIERCIESVSTWLECEVVVVVVVEKGEEYVQVE